MLACVFLVCIRIIYFAGRSIVPSSISLHTSLGHLPSTVHPTLCAVPSTSFTVPTKSRAMLFALGCIQSHKCNSNKCPTGITTQDPRLMAGLDVPDKAARVLGWKAQLTLDDMCAHAWKWQSANPHGFA